MQKLIPSFWYNRNATQAAELYLAAFQNAKIVQQQNYPAEGLPDFQKDFAGQPLVIELEIEGFRLTLTNADDHFSPNPSLSLMVSFDGRTPENPKAELKRIWDLLTEGGQVLMPLDSYDFSPYFGWCADRFGVNWQLMLRAENAPVRPFLQPALLFTQAARGRAAEAREKYRRVLSAIGESQEGVRQDYPDTPGIILFSDAQLAGVWTVINDSTFDHAFSFSEGASFSVYCQNQEQIDALWSELAIQEQPCGWCKDEFGFSWQILPENLDELMQKPDSYQKLMGMSKIEIAAF